MPIPAIIAHARQRAGSCQIRYAHANPISTAHSGSIRSECVTPRWLYKYARGASGETTISLSGNAAATKPIAIRAGTESPPGAGLRAAVARPSNAPLNA